MTGSEAGGDWLDGEREGVGCEVGGAGESSAQRREDMSSRREAITRGTRGLQDAVVVGRRGEEGLRWVNSDSLCVRLGS